MSIYTDKQLYLMERWQRGELERINILEGSVSSGKTWISLVLWAFWVSTMPNDPDSLYLMSARSLTTLKRNCLLLLQTLVGTQNFEFSISAKEGFLFGRHIVLEGANDAQAEAKIRGMTLQGAYADEITKLPEDFFTMLLSRLRKPGAKFIGTTNPDAPTHWLKEKYLDRESELSLLSMRFLIDDNTKLPEDYRENIKREYTGVFYSRFILGEWTLAEGLIYARYQECIEEVPDTQATDYRLSIDYGTRNAFAAIMWELHKGVWYAVNEYYYSGRDTGVDKTDIEYEEDMEAFILPYMDKVRQVTGRTKIKTIIDPSAASFIALIRKKGRFSVISADNDVIDGIRDTATCMLTGRIKVSPKLVNWRKEIAGYVWDEKQTKEAPIKVNDHLMDSMRYFVRTMGLARYRRSYNDHIPGFTEGGYQ